MRKQQEVERALQRGRHPCFWYDAVAVPMCLPSADDQRLRQTMDQPCLVSAVASACLWNPPNAFPRVGVNDAWAHQRLFNRESFAFDD